MGKTKLKLRKSNRKRSFLGFTLIECLLALLLLSIISMLFSASIKNTATVSNYLKSEKEKEWHIFVIQLEEELKNCRYEKTQANKIILRNKKNNNNVWIEYKLGKIVKVENGGYHPLLMKVKEAVFSEVNHTIEMQVILENDLMYSGKWIIPKEYTDE
ncbi:prepilin-type N-terminal cleavage/methylation domain-containing protein [Enterococcus moraviensis ATCC BAA-383]|uniref:Prepilin-type N-terminal cleavage/methylation domain-containing protein n=1 Tax=Enterococcus moraviensis ATCC BAA-383 TaxID=1158609 RepID=R2R5J9_9ENTE|nr:competence type IV pilus minor pilin ComGF [Enterococcus moraviensis]EOI03081.1 prepilin-type N-terminal cleavage/methylation domain-containing protein [Enterococcus moraviensis ATCC BAA-383]EOT74042.1 hypothetical protein I586_01038 [Enterococcus moraviensis ATCC BAA-383]